VHPVIRRDVMMMCKSHVSVKGKCHCVILASREGITCGVNETPQWIVGLIRVLGSDVHRFSFVSCSAVRVNNLALKLSLDCRLFM
jgi:hypothetical protein